MQGLNTSYAIASIDDAQRYPALQADNYQPANSKQEVNLCLSIDSVGMLGSNALSSMVMTPGVANFGGSEVEIGVLPGEIRWVVLAPPKIFAIHKDTRKVFYIQKGQRLKDLGRVNIARLLLAAVVEEAVVLDDDGLPQIFTLNLKSSKSALVGSSREADCGVGRNNGHRTIASLNKGLCEHYKLRNTWLTHLVSVRLKAHPEKFKSTQSNDASWGVRFVFDGGAKPLAEDQQKLVFDLISQESFKALAEDPFSLANREDQPHDAVETEVSWSNEEDPSAIPF